MPNKKNLKAAGYTSLVIALLFLLFFFVSWAPPAPTPIPKMEDIEVELGDAPEGASGNESAGAASAQENLSTETVTSPTPEKSIETNDADKEAPAIVSKPKAEVKKAAPVVDVPPPTPKYIYKGQGTRDGGQGTRSQIQTSDAVGSSGDK